MREIRALLETALYGDKKKIAKRFGVTPDVIYGISAGKSWVDVR